MCINICNLQRHRKILRRQSLTRGHIAKHDFCLMRIAPLDDGKTAAANCGFKNKYYMPRPRTALRERSLIKISIHRLIYSDGGWEKQIGPYSVALFPERVGNDHILSLFVNGQRQQKFWGLSTAPWGNRELRRNGFVPGSKEKRYYVHSSPTKRHHFIYVNPENFIIGTRPEMNAKYDCNCWSRKQRASWKEAMEIRRGKSD
jgi:hypothetical protein